MHCATAENSINLDRPLHKRLLCGMLLEIVCSPCKGLPGRSSDNILRHTSGTILDDCLNESSPLCFSGN